MHAYYQCPHILLLFALFFGLVVFAIFLAFFCPVVTEFPCLTQVRGVKKNKVGTAAGGAPAEKGGKKK